MPRMRLTLAELLDRFTIEKRKQYYGHGNEQLIFEVEHEIFGHIADICGGNDKIARRVAAVVEGAALLGIHNADIANCEWQVRAGAQLSLQEHGKRALITREINDRGRCAVKQRISERLEQNVETRHFGFGDDVKHSDLTLDVQEPAMSPSARVSLANNLEA